MDNLFIPAPNVNIPRITMCRMSADTEILVIIVPNASTSLIHMLHILAVIWVPYLYLCHMLAFNRYTCVKCQHVYSVVPNASTPRLHMSCMAADKFTPTL